MENTNHESHPYNTDKGWDKRYEKHGEAGAGTFVHSEKGNEQFYRTKFKAIDRCLKKINRSLQNASILDAAGGLGKFIDYFLKKGCHDILVTDFSQVALDKINLKYKNNPKISTQFFDLKSPQSLWTEKFDFIFVMEAIFLLESDEQLHQAFKNFSAALKSGGYIIISDLFPEGNMVKKGDYVIHRTKAHYLDVVKKNNLTVVDFVPQTVMFNRNFFSPIKRLLEQTGPLIYWLDQTAITLGFQAPSKNNVKYIIISKP
jgi:2-polyprenyl-3-methyl-5-hydroxy-6-metoxy-1,4-benzoquinol methylase